MASIPQKELFTQQINHLKSRIDQLQKQLKNKDGQITCLNDTIVAFKGQLQKQSEKRVEVERLLELKQKQIFEAGGLNLAKDNLLEQRQGEVKKYKNEIKELKQKLLNTDEKDKLVKVSGICNNSEESTQNEKIVKFNYLQLYELDRLQKENKRLANENTKLYNQLRQLSNDQFLTNLSVKTPDQIQVKIVSSNKHYINQKTVELAQNHPQQSEKQEQQGQQAPKKRKLMRKPRIQVDIDTFTVTPVNI